MTIELTKSQVSNLIDFIEIDFYDAIRKDTDIDNIDYAIDMMNSLQVLRKALADAKDEEEKVQSPYNDFM